MPLRADFRRSVSASRLRVMARNIHITMPTRNRSSACNIQKKTKLLTVGLAVIVARQRSRITRGGRSSCYGYTAVTPTRPPSLTRCATDPAFADYSGHSRPKEALCAITKAFYVDSILTQHYLTVKNCRTHWRSVCDLAHGLSDEIQITSCIPLIDT